MNGPPAQGTRRPLLDEAGVSAWLGIPAETLKKWRYLGRGPAYIKTGALVRYSPDDIDTYLAERRS